MCVSLEEVPTLCLVAFRDGAAEAGHTETLKRESWKEMWPIFYILQHIEGIWKHCVYINSTPCLLKVSFFICRVFSPLWSRITFKTFSSVAQLTATVKRCFGYKFQRNRSTKLQALHWANYIIAAIHRASFGAHRRTKLEIFTTASRHRHFSLNPDLIWFLIVFQKLCVQYVLVVTGGVLACHTAFV